MRLAVDERKRLLVAKAQAAINDCVMHLSAEEAREAMIDLRDFIEHRVYQTGGPSHIRYQCDGDLMPVASPEEECDLL